MLKNQLNILILLIGFGLLSSQSISFDPFYLNDKNRSTIERAGDILQLALPLTGLGLAYVSNDNDGKSQFWKSYISSISLTYLLKYTVKKERPNGDCCESFPSGHTTTAFSGAMFINKRYGPKYGIPSMLLASFVGYSRVYAMKHYWIDVICGAAIGIFSNILFTSKDETRFKNLTFQSQKDQYQLRFIYSF